MALDFTQDLSFFFQFALLSVCALWFIALLSPQKKREGTFWRSGDEKIGPQRQTQSLKPFSPGYKRLKHTGRLGSHSCEHYLQAQLSFECVKRKSTFHANVKGFGSSIAVVFACRISMILGDFTLVCILCNWHYTNICCMFTNLRLASCGWNILSVATKGISMLSLLVLAATTKCLLHFQKKQLILCLIVFSLHKCIC